MKHQASLPMRFARGIAISACTLFLCLVPRAALSQHDYDVWHFGLGFGFDFTGGTPVYLPSTPCRSLESSAVICDRNTGELLFVAAAGVIYNRFGTTMPNGAGILDGGYTSAQGEVIVPDPCDSLRYYVFTADQAGYVSPNQGINYSVVDMRLDSGRGDVTLKNVRLLDTAWEYLTAVMQANGHDYWVVAHSFGGRSFYAFAVTSSGVSSTPVVSVVGTDHRYPPATREYPLGELKSSPDGRLLACAGMYLGLLELYDFDPSTGILSNARQIRGPSTPEPTKLYYGVAFSPGGRYLYTASNTLTYRNYTLWQFDLATPDLASIQASATIVSSASASNNDALLGMQRGPDSKIYVVMGHGGIGVIGSPDSKGLVCDFRPNVFMTTAPGTNSNDRIMALPNNIDDRRYFDRPRPAPRVRIVDVDQPDTCSAATLTAAPGYASYSWSTGERTATIAAPVTGTYVVHAIDTIGCEGDDSVSVYVADCIDTNVEYTWQLPDLCIGRSERVRVGYYNSGYQDTVTSITVSGRNRDQIHVDTLPPVVLTPGKMVGIPLICEWTRPASISGTLLLEMSSGVTHRIGLVGRVGGSAINPFDVTAIHLGNRTAPFDTCVTLTNLFYTTIHIVDTAWNAGGRRYRVTAPSLPILVPPGGRFQLCLTSEGAGIGDAEDVLYLAGEGADSCTVPFCLAHVIVIDTLPPGPITPAGISMIAHPEIALSVAPNPMTNAAVLSVELRHAGDATVTLVDARGNVRAELLREHCPAGVTTIPVQASTFPSGIYYLRLDVDGMTINREVVVVH